jgi:Tol biopolymer transport system component
VAEVGGNHQFDFSVSGNGSLAYQMGNPKSELTWVDRTGKKLSSVGEPRNYSSLNLSPDQKRALVSLLDSDGRISDIWLADLTRDNFSRLTFDSAGESDGQWSPDGNTIVFGSNRRGNGAVDLYQMSAGGAGGDQLVFSSDSAKFPTSWSTDGQILLFENWGLKEKAGVWVLTLRDKQPKPLLQSNSYDQMQAQISPDGHLVAYTSNESGSNEVYVQPLVSNGEKWRISSNGGMFPSWRRDGKELYYITEAGRLMSSEIISTPKFTSSVPKELFQAKIKNSGQGLCYGASSDGQRFLIITFVESNNPAPMTVVLNWTSDLAK